MNKAILDEYGIDYRTGAARFRGNEEIFEKLLRMFLEDSTFARMQIAHDAGNPEELFASAHEMKGVSGNTALTSLYDADCRLVESLRTGERDGAKIDALFAEVEAAYRKAFEGVRLALET